MKERTPVKANLYSGSNNNTTTSSLVSATESINSRINSSDLNELTSLLSKGNQPAGMNDAMSSLLDLVVKSTQTVMNQSIIHNRDDDDDEEKQGKHDIEVESGSSASIVDGNKPLNSDEPKEATESTSDKEENHLQIVWCDVCNKGKIGRVLSSYLS